jgi:cytoskeleton protein RodZ
MAPKQGTATAARPVEGAASVPVVESSRPADAAAFGAFLREQREARHLTVRQIAEITKISSHHFHALERGDIRRWPGGMYRRAMFRAYAQAIGLDTEHTVRTFLEVFSEEPADAPVASRPVEHAIVPGSDVIRRAGSAVRSVSAAVAVLLMGWYAATYFRGTMKSDRASTLPPSPTEAKATLEMQPALEPVVDTQATLTATAGTARETVSSPAPAAAAPVDGELRVQSDPDGAQVTVNGIGWGRTPVTVKYLPLGEKRVRLTKDGYATAERRIQITAERPVRPLHVTLQPRANDN